MILDEKAIRNLKIGMEGEGKIRDYLSKKNIRFMQIDLIFEYNGKIYICEVKTQEKYKSPPFDGHGLPPYQMKARIEFAKKIGAIPILFVNDIDDGIVYYQDMRKLQVADASLKHYTKTKSRIIFCLSLFNKLKI